VGEDAGRRAVAGVQLGRPEQRVEIEDVLADEVIQLGASAVGLVPELVEIEAPAGRTGS
jgi:hypothetical protein